MAKGSIGIAATSFVAAAFLWAGSPAQAQNVDERIKALEQELTQLKEQQIELKKEATEAAAAMPTFSYRPGNGMMIEAADKAWGFRVSMETHWRMMFESGKDQVGRTQGEIMNRRFRPIFFYCINNCLYEIETALDMDGFGTGNAKNSTNSGGSSIMQRGAIHFHLENLNPWMPTMDVGGDVSAASTPIAKQGSSSIGSQMEYDFVTRNVGPNTGRAGYGIVLNWDDRSLSGIGIPGRIGRYQISMGSISEGDDNLSSFKDRKNFNTYLSLYPFSQLKNKWIRGLAFEWGAWFCNVDDRPQADNGCDRVRIQDHGDAGRQTLFNTGSNSIGKGLATFLSRGIMWEVGPYRLRLLNNNFQAADGNDTGGGNAAVRGKKRARNFLIGHDLFIWSPKGFLTGSAATAGSVLLGTHFERADVSCDVPRCPATINGSQFHRGAYILREWDIFYFLAARMSIGAHVLWYDASNLTTTVQRNLNIRRVGVAGRGGEWVDGNLNFRYQF